MHTKGKWKYEDEYVRADTGDIIADVYFSEGMYWTKTDNARRICQCVNNFDDLLDACRKIVKLADKALNSNNTKRGIILTDIGNIAEAQVIAAAEKGD